MDKSRGDIERNQPLYRLKTPGLSAQIQAYRAAYHREIPSHYQDNPHVRQQVDLNVLIADAGLLVVPTTPLSTFQKFYQELRRIDPNIVGHIVSPSGSAKSASSTQLTPIKEITRRNLSGISLPGDEELYGWGLLEADVSRAGLDLLLMFQGNGLYFNRGSVLFDGHDLHDYPNSILADFLEEKLPAVLEWIGVGKAQLKRPLLFFITDRNGQMTSCVHRFNPEETYRQGMDRLLSEFRRQGYRAALSASPPLILPDGNHQPTYLSLADILGQFHANDIRHYLYCPYEGAVLLSAELGRAQCLDPESLAGSLSGASSERVRVRCDETLRFVSAEKLEKILENKGYARRFALEKVDRQVGKDEYYLSINPLEGIYSHLVLFLTQQGRFGIIQTSGTHGNITGNDGPTFAQLSAMLRDLNAQPLFEHDLIVAASSGSQGNDVPNVIGRGQTGIPDLLSKIAPQLALDDRLVPRGIVTTPRVGIAVPPTRNGGHFNLGELPISPSP